MQIVESRIEQFERNYFHFIVKWNFDKMQIIDASSHLLSLHESEF